MKIVFISCYYSNHQIEFSETMKRLTNNNFYFISTSEINHEAIVLGRQVKQEPSFVLQYQLESAKCKNLIEKADIVISAGLSTTLIKKRLKEGKLTFLYSERLYKNGFKIMRWPFYLINHQINIQRYKNLYMLCSSAFLIEDCRKTFILKNKFLKWGYFPETRHYVSIENLLNKKEKNSIIWVGRFIDWKHPETAILLAKRLKEEKIDFSLTMIGTGYMFDEIKDLIKKHDLGKEVKLLGSMPYNEVRDYMEKSQIHIATSDFNEGWGAVINESMNSCCVTVASYKMGAAPYLIKDYQNGILYKDFEDLYYRVKYILSNKSMAEYLGIKAYETIINTWCGKISAERLCEISKKLLQGDKRLNIYNEGPCSIAKRIKNDWYLKERKN